MRYKKVANGTITFVIVMLLIALLFPVALQMFYEHPITQYRQSTIYLSEPENPILFYLDFGNETYANLTFPLELEDLPPKEPYEFQREFVMLMENNTETNTTMDYEFYDLVYENITYGMNYSFPFLPIQSETINLTIHVYGAWELNFNLSLFMNIYTFDKIMVSLDAIYSIVPLFLAITIIVFVVSKMRVKID